MAGDQSGAFRIAMEDLGDLDLACVSLDCNWRRDSSRSNESETETTMAVKTRVERGSIRIGRGGSLSAWVPRTPDLSVDWRAERAAHPSIGVPDYGRPSCRLIRGVVEVE